MVIRETGAYDLREIMDVQQAAFGSEEEARLTADLLEDESAFPQLSLLAYDEEQAIGHVLFTAAGCTGSDCSAMLLAPLGVIGQRQRQGVGVALVTRGIEILRDSGTDLICVLGSPGYYHRFGFRSAYTAGIAAPYPIEEDLADAWMYLALNPDHLPTGPCTFRCARSLMDPKLWRE
jgi:putative acetyltransferase